MSSTQIKAYIQAHLSGYKDAQVDNLIMSVSLALSGVDEELAMRRWHFILESLESPRFPAAIFTQALTAQDLVRTDEPRLAAKIAKLATMSLDAFERFISKRHVKHADPQVSTSRPADTQGPGATTPGPSEKAGKPSKEKTFEDGGGLPLRQAGDKR